MHRSTFSIVLFINRCVLSLSEAMKWFHMADCKANKQHCKAELGRLQEDLLAEMGHNVYTHTFSRV